MKADVGLSSLGPLLDIFFLFFFFVKNNDRAFEFDEQLESGPHPSWSVVHCLEQNGHSGPGPVADVPPLNRQHVKR